MSNVENVWEFSTPESGRAFHLKCGFKWHLNQQETGPLVAIKINSGQTIDIYKQFHYGDYKGKGLEISFRGVKLKTCNYMNIIMSIKSTDSSISKYSICNYFDTYIGSDSHKASGLSGFRGWRGFNDSHSVNFIFNNSQKVTPVSYAHYSSGGYFLKQNPIDDMTIIKSDAVSLSWEDREISQGEVQEIRYSIGIGEYIVGYEIEVKTEIAEFYSPGSEISLNIDVLDNFIGDHLKIMRTIDSGNEETIYDEYDNGEHVNIYDNFTLPNSIDFHTIKYVTRNNQSVEAVIEVKILVNIKPVLTISPNISTEYPSGEEVSFSAIIFDDSPVSFIVNIDENNKINETVDCNMNPVKKDFKLQLPIVQSDEQHTIYIVCLDKFGNRSNLITEKYTIVAEPPKIKISNNISYLQSPYSRIFLTGEVSYENRQSITCLYTNIEKRFEINSSCQMIGTSWKKFNISREIPPVLGGIYRLEIYASDINNRRSDIIRQFFAVAIRSNCNKNCNDMFTLRSILLLFQFIISS